MLLQNWQYIGEKGDGAIIFRVVDDVISLVPYPQPTGIYDAEDICEEIEPAVVVNVESRFPISCFLAFLPAGFSSESEADAVTLFEIVRSSSRVGARTSSVTSACWPTRIPSVERLTLSFGIGTRPRLRQR